MVFDSVVSSAFEDFGDFSPFITIASMHEIKNPLFFFAPTDLLNLRIKMVVPSLSTLLANPSWKVLSNQCPLLWSILFDQVKDHSVFFLSPRSFYEAWVEDLLPSVEALDISPAWEVLSDLLPVLASMTLDCICKLVILKP